MHFNQRGQTYDATLNRDEWITAFTYIDTLANQFRMSKPAGRLTVRDVGEQLRANQTFSSFNELTLQAILFTLLVRVAFYSYSNLQCTFTY